MSQNRPKSVTAIVCDKCDRSFGRKARLYMHKKKFHPDEKTTFGNQVCPMCHERFFRISNLHNHLQTNHEVRLNFSHKTFYTYEDFIEWKDNVERETISKFNRISNATKKSGVKFEYYHCHRSGKIQLKADRVRHVKSSGSIKCGSTCPSLMNVMIETFEGISEIKVEFQSVHIGHEQEVGTLTLTKAEKTNLALQLDMGVPKSIILDQTREQYSPTKRFGLTTRKDLHNICKQFCIENKAILHADDSTSVDIKVKKMLSSEDNPILIYKPLGEQLEGFPEIESQEFLLGIMNEAQCNLFEMYGSSGVMVDSTHGTNQYGFQLTTLMVHDSHHEGFPVATLFSSRTAEAALLPFFVKIREKLPSMKTKFIMSDDTTSFFNAWRKAFNDDSKHILCSWHVMRNLTSNAKSKVKYADIEQLKNDLKLLVNEVDVTTFKVMLNNFLCKYEENEKEFVKYFRETYCKRTEKWAYCYRVGMGINTNMKVERWHRQLKHEEAGGTVMKRLDKALNIVLNAVAKKLLSRIISLERGKLSHRVALIRARHNVGLELSQNGYSIYELENGQIIVSKIEESGIVSYTIEKNDENCTCNIKCDMCNICVHSMSCTCVDYSVRFVICKHIHFVQFSRIQGQTREAEMEDANGDDANLIADIDETKTQRDAEKDAIIPTLVEKRKHSGSEEQYRGKTFSIMDRVVSRCKNANLSNDDLKYIQETMKTLESYLDRREAPSSELPFNPILDIAKAPINKQIEPQRKFIKKKKKKSRNI